MRFVKYFSAVLIVIILAGFTVYAFYYNKNINYVTIDINPSVEFVLRKDDKVLGVYALNEDANILLVDLNLEGMQYKEALKILVEASILMGYIDEFSDENSMLITAYSNKENNSNRLTDLTISTLREYIETRKAYCLLMANGLTDEQKVEARMLKISNEKMMFIDRLINMDESYTKDDLSEKSLFRIQSLIKKRVIERERKTSVKRVNREDIWKEEKARIIQAFQTKKNEYREELYLNSTLYDENATEQTKQAIIDNLVNNEKETIRLNIKEFSDRLIEENNTNFVEEKSYAIIKNNYEQVKNLLKQGKEN